MLKQLNGNNLQENYYRTVTTIYLKSWAIGVKSFSSADSNSLNFIAHQNSLVGGEAVLTARAMLGLVIIDPNIAQNSQKLKQNLTVNQLSVSPNPVTDKITVKFDIATENTCIFELYDIMGRLVFSKLIQPNTLTEIIDISNLQNGVYLIKTSGDNITPRDEKVMIVK
jgi:hypothetical protein